MKYSTKKNLKDKKNQELKAAANAAINKPGFVSFIYLCALRLKTSEQGQAVCLDHSELES